MIKKLTVPFLILTNCLSLTTAYFSEMHLREFKRQTHADKEECTEEKTEMEEEIERQRRVIRRLREQIRPTARMMRN